MWKKKTTESSHNQKIGVPIKSTNGEYLTVYLLGKSYAQHRIAFLITNGFSPFRIDHINRNGHDNRIDNLRECTISQNNSNQGVRKDTKSGYKGVVWDKQHNKWRARIIANNKTTFLGRFDCKHDAARAYNEAARMYHGKFAYLNEINQLPTALDLSVNWPSCGISGLRGRS